LNSCKHLVWISFGALAGFLASFIFGDMLSLPLDVYYLVYFGIIIVLFFIYVRKTRLSLKRLFYKRFLWGIALGLLVAAVMAQNVLSRPETARLSGAFFAWAVFWRGLVYGVIDGLLLTVFPWVVTWRAFDGESKRPAKKIALSLLAWIFIIVTTTAYHLGYSDFRSKKIVQANIGNTIMSLATLIPANPIGTPIAHAALHITAVIHSPGTELFLPPHRDADLQEEGHGGEKND